LPVSFVSQLLAPSTLLQHTRFSHNELVSTLDRYICLSITKKNKKNSKSNLQGVTVIDLIVSSVTSGLKVIQI